MASTSKSAPVKKAASKKVTSSPKKSVATSKVRNPIVGSKKSTGKVIKPALKAKKNTSGAATSGKKYVISTECYVSRTKSNIKKYGDEAIKKHNISLKNTGEQKLNLANYPEDHPLSNVFISSNASIIRLAHRAGAYRICPTVVLAIKDRASYLTKMLTNQAMLQSDNGNVRTLSANHLLTACENLGLNIILGNSNI
jgi:hypothetical protein